MRFTLPESSVSQRGRQVTKTAPGQILFLVNIGLEFVFSALLSKMKMSCLALLAQGQHKSGSHFT